MKRVLQKWSAAPQMIFSSILQRPIYLYLFLNATLLIFLPLFSWRHCKCIQLCLVSKPFEFDGFKIWIIQTFQIKE